MKKHYILFLTLSILLIASCFIANADETSIVENSIQACKAGSETREEQICQELKELFGEDSELLYSLEETENCRSKTSINVNEEQIVIYLSNFETTNPPEIFNLNTCDSEKEVCRVLQSTYGKSSLYSFTKIAAESPCETKYFAFKETIIR